MATVLERAKAQLVLNEPFYATIMLNMKLVECAKTPDGQDLWLAATNGTELFVNPANFEQLTVAKAKGVLKHEIMHVAQLHPWRGEGKEHERWNHATDYTINPLILDEGGELPEGCLDGSNFKGLSAEQIYNKLPPSPPKNGGGGQGQGKAQGQHGSGAPGGNPLGNDIMPAKDKSESAVEAAKVMISQAAQVAKAMGKLPASLQADLDEIFKPKVDWREQLRQFLTETCPSDYSFSRPNRRYIAGEDPMYLPSMAGHDSMASLVVVMDTSGSITMDELKQGLGEIVGAVEDVAPKRLVVAYCDAKVQHADVFDNPSEAVVTESFKRHGAGGTSMVAALRWAQRKHPNAQAVVVWTDGEFSYEDTTEDTFPFSVVWAISNKRYTAPWGTTIHVDVD